MKNRKKISIIFGSIIFGIININTVFAQTGTITTETIRIREKASTESKILDIGSLNEKVEILGEEDGWYKVDYKGIQGYIYKNYLKPDEKKVDEEEPTEEPINNEEPSVEPTTEPNPIEESAQNNTERKIGNITNNQSNIYLTPNFSSIKISKIEKDTKLEIKTTLGNWSKIIINKEEGWIPNEILMEETQNEQNTNKQPEVQEENNQENQPEQVTSDTSMQAEKVETQINETGYISSNASANLRVAPSTTSESRAKLPKNTKLTVISEEDGWYRVNYNGTQGYISKSLVTIGNPEEETSSRNGDISRIQEISSQNASTIAQNYLGKKYISGGTSPETGFDCSGFTQYVYRQCGIELSRTASSQANNGKAIEKSELQPGDLLLFHYYGSKTIDHVGIYTGNGQFIHSANPQRGVVYDTIESGYYAQNYVGARRL